MLDMMKLVVAEAHKQCQQIAAQGVKIDAVWLDALRGDLLLHKLQLLDQGLSYKGVDLIAALVEVCEVESALTPTEWLEGVYQHALYLNFPQVGVASLYEGIAQKAPVFLMLFRGFHRVGLKRTPQAFLARFPFNLLQEDEVNGLENPDEYRAVVSAFYDSYIYEMMVLNYELKGYSTVDHISGVHYLAMFIAKQLQDKGIPIDLGLVSGAAALHDVGKFGCLPEEARKVAYYHYYYSDLWFRDRGITYIRQIAVNHSTWDLELSYLPIESLVLIYADFRVKAHEDPFWPYPMKFFDLEESFHVILEKLDDVDAAKELRYRKVYDKLLDFERFLKAHHIKTVFDVPEPEGMPWYHKDPSLLSGDEVLLRYKTIAVAYNIKAMHTFRHENALNDFLYDTKNQEDAHVLRRNIQLMTQFSRYLTDGQKQLIMDFLFNLFAHQEEDIRKQAAESMGEILSAFDAPYGKYLPPSAPETAFKASKSSVLKRYCEIYLAMEDMTSLKVERIGMALVNVINTMMRHAKIIEPTVDLVLEQLQHPHRFAVHYYFKVFHNLPLANVKDNQLEAILKAVIPVLQDSEGEQRIDAYLALCHLKKHRPDLVGEVLVKSGLSEHHHFHGIGLPLLAAREDLTHLYLANSKLSTPQEIKKLNLKAILTFVIREHSEEAFYAAIHCCNILKNNTSQEVRLAAAKVLVVLDTRLSASERNEVVMELLRGLEIDHYAFTKYMPQTLGRILIHLDDALMSEMLEDLTLRLKTGNDALKVLIIETISHAYNAGIVAKARSGDRDIPLNRMLGMLFIGLVQESRGVHLASFKALTTTLLDTHLTTRQQKGEAFLQLSKKMLCLTNEISDIEEKTMAYAAGFSDLYAFITHYLHEVGPFENRQPRGIAFFQGAFDPISIGQKSVVKSLLAEGLEVYVALDAYSWKRRTQPPLLRRALMQMTLSDLSNVYILPRDFSVHYGCASDLDHLRESFSDQKVYLVMGEDALITHPAYRAKPMILKDWPHYIVGRSNLSAKKHSEVQNIIGGLSDVQFLKPIGEEAGITPDHVRRAIDRHNDLNDVLDPLTNFFIEEHHMYRNEPQFKSSLERKHIDVVTLDNLSEQCIQEVWDAFQIDLKRARVQSEDAAKTLRLIIIRDRHTHDLIALGGYRRLEGTERAQAFDDVVMRRDYTDLYEENTAVIEWLHALPQSLNDEYAFTLQTELMVDAMNQGYDYVIYWPTAGMVATDVLEALRCMGFVEVPSLRLLLVSLKAPVAVLLDAQTMLKEDYRKVPEIRQHIKAMRIKLMQSIVRCYPRQVVLAFDRGMLYDRLVHMISELNPPSEVTGLGNAVAVPFGDLFKRWTLPHTITKALHTERVYDSTLSFFDVQASPYHLSLNEQISFLNAFEAPIILIDDLLDKGLRLQAIEADLKKLNLTVDSVVVGIMSNLGKRRLEQKGYTVHGGYYVANLQAWYTESLLYPFVGGDAYGPKQLVSHGVLHAVNRILPYYGAPESKGMTHDHFLNFSYQCLQNAYSLMHVLEEHYHQRHHRPLSIEHLSEVFINPKMPHYGDGLAIEQSGLPTAQLKHDILRLEQTIRVTKY